MTTKILGEEGFKWFIGVVEDRDDPEKEVEFVLGFIIFMMKTRQMLRQKTYLGQRLFYRLSVRA